MYGFFNQKQNGAQVLAEMDKAAIRNSAASRLISADLFILCAN